MKNSSIFLIRHGLTEGNIKDWYYGGADIPLIPEAFSQLDEYIAGEIYPKGDDISFYTSGMIRAIQTLQHIWGEVAFDIIDDFREFNFGDYECTPQEEILRDDFYQNWLKPEYSNLPLPGGGDSRESFSVRIGRGLKHLLATHAKKELSLRHKEQEARTVMVCHGGVIGKTMEITFPDEFDHTFRRMPEPGRGFHLQVQGGEITGYDYV